MKRAIFALALAISLAGGLRADDDHSDQFEFKPDTLVLSRSVYAGTPSTVTIGQILPPGCVAGTVPVPLLAGGSANVKVKCSVAIADGTYPTVFNKYCEVTGLVGSTTPGVLELETSSWFGAVRNPGPPR